MQEASWITVLYLKLFLMASTHSPGSYIESLLQTWL